MGTGAGAGGGGDDASTAVGGIAAVCVVDCESEPGAYTIGAGWADVEVEVGGTGPALLALTSPLPIGTAVGIDVEAEGDVVGSCAFETGSSDGLFEGGFWLGISTSPMVGVWDTMMIEWKLNVKSTMDNGQRSITGYLGIRVEEWDAT
ncbi:hypothetical protein EMPG_16613 [Blastomyces silverae]|uniref:Uncharacterized protein n=1 Tax=Blastomyces silverae TaxID=2060906 RepID=A0A0H1B965_9EURO|nr:hypothetical protein EMPG_16613 [Blastomyces silverae]